MSMSSQQKYFKTSSNQSYPKFKKKGAHKHLDEQYDYPQYDEYDYVQNERSHQNYNYDYQEYAPPQLKGQSNNYSKICNNYGSYDNHGVNFDNHQHQQYSKSNQYNKYSKSNNSYSNQSDYNDHKQTNKRPK